MLLHHETLTQQQMFTDYCRTGESHPIIGASPERLAHYRRLVTNIIDDTLASAYPLTNELLTAKEWERLVHNFFSRHNCSSYQIWQMPFELIAYVGSNEVRLQNKYPFLMDLLRFEWLEIEIHMMEDVAVPSFKENGDLVHDTIMFNPEFSLLQVSYPVHLKNPKKLQAVDRGAFTILVYRDLAEGKVEFMDISLLFAWFIQGAHNERKTIAQLASEAAGQVRIPVTEIINNTLPFLRELQNKKFIIGFSNETGG